MTAAEITQMISTDTFPEVFNSFQREKIKNLWLDGRVREAQQEAQSILEKPVSPKKKTLL